MPILKFSLAKNVTDIPKEIEELHFTRPLKFKEIEKILKKCKGLKKISMPKSSWLRLSRKAKELLQKSLDIVISENAIKGRPIGLELEKIIAAVELYKEYKSFRKIAEELNIAKSTAHYLIKYAKRKKFRKGKNVVVIG